MVSPVDAVLPNPPDVRPEVGNVVQRLVDRHVEVAVEKKKLVVDDGAFHVR